MLCVIIVQYVALRYIILRECVDCMSLCYIAVWYVTSQMYVMPCYYITSHYTKLYVTLC